jgi:tetratricopeptide (TPR) repeat protein
MQTPLFSAAVLAVGLAVSAVSAIGQQRGGQTQAPPSGGGATGGGGTGAGAGGRTPTTPTPPTQTPRQPDFGQQQQQQRETFPEMRQQPLYLSGRVLLDDGTPPPEIVIIESVCSGVARQQAYTDSKGRFSFQWGQNTSMMMDASTSSMDSRLPIGNAGSGMGRGGLPSNLMACELRANLAGFRSDSLNLAGRRSLDNPEVGTIVLHRLGNVEGTTISATSILAPKDAKKAYEKGTEANKKKKWAEAQKNLEKAVELYPKYASAWFELGVAYHQQQNLEQARNAYAKSLEADPKFLKPYMQMAVMSANEQKWDEVERYTSELLRLDPVDFAAAYFYNSVANFNLQKFDAAEKSAREGLKLDPQHQLPKMQHVLGVILANKRDYAGAAEQLRGYLEHAPGAQDADTVRKQLVEIERFAGPAQAPPQQ